MIQMGYIQCTKDTYEIINHCLSEKLLTAITNIQSSSVIAVYDASQVDTGPLQVSIVPKNIDLTSVQFDNYNLLAYINDGSRHLVLLEESTRNIKPWNLKASVIISNLNEFWVGDLKFLGYVLVYD